MKTVKLSLFLLLAALAPRFASALVFGPYTPDASTAYLFHFNEPAGSYIATNASGSLSAGTNAVAYNTVTGNTFPGLGVTAPTNFNVLGATSASGFSFGNFDKAANLANVVSGTNGLGVDIDLNGGFELNNGGNSGTNAFDTRTNLSMIIGANNSFTLEALINIASTNGNQEIICTDNGLANSARGFQFRLTGARMEFFDIGTGAGAVAANDVFAFIPSTGNDAFVPNTWYHVAVTHTEIPTPGGTNTIFYWTLLNDTNVTAHAIATNTAALVDPTDPMILVIGNEGRSAGSSLGSSEGLQGLIDEARISKVSRAANQMMFFTPVITFLTQPSSQTIATNTSVSFNVLAAGAGTVTYQWYSFDGSSTNTLLSQTNTTLTITAGSTAAVSNYFAVGSNGISTPATSSVAVLIIRIPSAKQWKGAGTDWDTTTANWTTDGGVTATTYTEVDNVTFDSLGVAQPTVNIPTSHNPLLVTVNATTDYSLGGTGAGVIFGPGSIIKSGSGKLTLTTPHTYSGGSTINAGTIQLDNSGALGTGPVVNNGSIVVNTTNTATFPGSISGAGDLTVQAGSASLSVSNTYAGQTTVSGGRLFVSNGSGLGDVSSGTAVAAGGQVYVTANVNFGPEAFIIAGIGDNNGALRKGGAGGTTLAGTVSMTADSTIGVDASATLTISNTLSGPGALTKNGSGTLALGDNNTYGGKTIVNAGTLSIASASALGAAPGSFTADQITLGGGTLDASANITLNDDLRGISVTTITDGLSVSSSNATFTVSNTIAGNGTLTKSGPGTLVINGNNSSLFGTLNIDTSQAGSPGVNDGITRLASPNAITGIASIGIRNNNAGFSTLQLDGSNGALTISQSFSWSGRNNLVPAIENVSGNNTLSPSSIAWNVGGGTYQIQSDAGTLTVGGSSLPVSAPAGFRTAMFSGSGNIVVSATVQDIAGTTTNSLLKTGSGTVTLQAANTYTGGTVISNGVLLVDGSIAAGGALTNVGGSLGGIGTINRAVIIQSGATLSPGDFDVGTLTVNSNMTISGNLLFPINKSLTPSNSLAVVSGTLVNTGTGTLTLTNLGSALAVGDTFKLFSQPISGGGALVVTGVGAAWQNNLAVDGSVSVASLTVPHPVINSISLNGTNLILSGTNGYATGTYYVLSSTNVILPLTQWTPLLTNTFDGSGNFAITNAFTPGMPQQFYILKLP